MLSMFKDKKGFSVLFRDTERDAASSAPPRATDGSGSARPSSRPSSVVQLQCQRCSKRFSAIEEAPMDEAQSSCRRCGYLTCPQCRESVPGTPPWVCCLCVGAKSFMWLLEKTKAGPLLATKIVEYCDPRGQRLMRSMFRFTLLQYRAVPSPRPSLTAGSGRLSGSAPPSSLSRHTTSQTPPAAPLAKAAAAAAGRGAVDGAAGSGGLSAASANRGNVRKSSPYSHPKHVSLLRSSGRLSGPATAGEKENAPQGSESPKRLHGSELLRRDDAVGVVEYSPEPNREVVPDTAGADSDGEPHSTPPLPRSGGGLGASPPMAAGDMCTAVQDIYRASDTAASARRETAGAVDEANASPHVRPSGHAAFQREPLRELPPPSAATTRQTAPDRSSGPVTPADREAAVALPGMDGTAASITPPGQPCRFGRSRSGSTDRSGRSESPAPRFPSFTQFLDDHAAAGGGQAHPSRRSDVLVTVSPDSDDDGGGRRGSDVLELGATRASRTALKSSNHRNGKASGLRTPRGTPPSHPDSSGTRNDRRASGLSTNEFTPTRVLDLSDARPTIRHGSSSRRRTTRGSLLEMHAPHLYGSAGGGSRRSGQGGDSPFQYDLPSQFGINAGTRRVASARGLQRRPLATRTAGRPLGGSGAGGGGVSVGSVRLARQTSRHTPTPLQRTASRNDALQRVPSGSRSAMARTHSGTAPFARKGSLTGFGRLHSGTAQLTRTPSSRTHLAGVPASPNTRALLQRTESSKLCRTASSGLPLAHADAPPAVPTAPLERTFSRGGLAAGRAAPLERIASSTYPAAGGASPFRRFHSANSFSRSATATAAFARTHSALAVGGRSSGSQRDGPARQPVSRAANAFARTATGTYLSSGPARTRVAGVAHRSVVASAGRYGGAYPRAGASGGGRPLPPRHNTPGSRPGAASPLHRCNTATRTATAAAPAAGVRPPTPTAFARTATGSRGFERQASHPLRHPTPSAAGPRRVVDPAPALMGTMRRKAPVVVSGGPAAAAALRRTPSAMARHTATATATPRTPRPYIISSVSTAATPAAPHTGVRPVLSSGASSCKTRSTRDSLTSGGGTARTSGDSNALAEVAPVSTPVVKAPSGAALGGRTSVPRRRPATGAAPSATEGAGGRGGAFTRLGTGTAVGREGRTKTGSAHPTGNLVRMGSRSAAS